MSQENQLIYKGKNVKYLIFLMVIVMLTGCAANMKSELGDIPKYQNNLINVIDKRKPQDKLFKKVGGLYLPVRKLGDSNFSPDIIKLFRYSLFKEAKSNNKKYNLQIDKLDIFDVYPERLSQAISAGISGGLAGIGVYAGNSNSVKNTDFVLVEFKGLLNGKPISKKARAAYHASAMSTNIFNDSSFRKAVHSALNGVVKEITTTN